MGSFQQCTGLDWPGVRHGQLQHDGCRGEQNERMNRHQRQQGDQSGLSVRQFNQRDANHHHVGKHPCQGHDHTTCGEPIHRNQHGKESERGEKIGADGPQIKLLDVHIAHWF